MTKKLFPFKLKKTPRIGLRVKVVVGVTLPLVAFLFLNSYSQYVRDHQMYVQEMQLITEQLGEMIKGSLHHAMRTNNNVLLLRLVDDVSKVADIKDVRIVNLQGVVKVSNQTEEVGQVTALSEIGCVECHQKSVAQQPQSARFSSSSRILRIEKPIDNEPACQSCHDPTQHHLGILMVDVSTQGYDTRLISDLQGDLLWSLLGVAAIVLITYWLINRHVVRRIEKLREPIVAYSMGDFSAREPELTGAEDEITDLARAFNHMADEIDRHKREQEKMLFVRTEAIVQERERIARELHDGLGQLIAYVNTKAYTVRLLLKKAKSKEAEKELVELEEAAQGLFVDMREAVLSLRMACRDDDLPNAIRYFVSQFNHLSDLPVEVKIDDDIESCSIDTEVQLHLLRIVQEAISNARKYAQASLIEVKLSISDGILHLVVSDNGQGFDVGQSPEELQLHFGLSTIRERAEATGGQFRCESTPGSGTVIQVDVPLKGN